MLSQNTKRLMMVLFLGSQASWSQSGSSDEYVLVAESNGQYEVPVPERLRDYANFEITGVTVERKLVRGDAYARVTYHLPPELVGPNEHPVVLEGKVVPDGEEFKLEGEAGKAKCVEADGEVSCRVKYEHAPRDPAGAFQVVRERSQSQAEFVSRAEVTARFGGDPVGILKYPAPAPR